MAKATHQSKLRNPKNPKGTISVPNTRNNKQTKIEFIIFPNGTILQTNEN